MGQKGSKEGEDVDGTLIRSLVIDQASLGGANDDDSDVVEAPGGRSARHKSMQDIEVNASGIQGNGNTYPKRQNLFEGDLEVVPNRKVPVSKSEKKSNSKRSSSSSKRKTPSRRRSARVAPSLPPPSGADASGVAPTTESFFELHKTSEVCVEVEDETREASIESETESLSLRPTSDSESDSGRVAVRGAASNCGTTQVVSIGACLKHHQQLGPQPGGDAAGGIAKVSGYLAVRSLCTNNGPCPEEMEAEMGIRRERENEMEMLMQREKELEAEREGKTLDKGYMTAQELYNAMNDGEISPYLFDPCYLLIIDTQDLGRYRGSHIVTAYHASVLKEEDRVGYPLTDFTIVILYDSSGNSCLSSSTGVLRKLHAKLNEKPGVHPFILRGGFSAFSVKYPFMCTDQIIRTERERRKFLIQYPSEIIPDTLYLGRGDQATNEDIVNNLEITHVVNITTSHPDAFPDRLKYLDIRLPDEPTTNLLNVLLEMLQFTRDAVSGGGRVFVHCNLGRSRSAMAVIAYLMTTRSWTLKKAFIYVKERRPIIEPNHGFLQQLVKFEEDLLGISTSDPEELLSKI